MMNKHIDEEKHNKELLIERQQGNEKKDKVKLDIVLKYLFSTSEKVLIKLLNGVFNENFNVDEVKISVSNNEFVDSDLNIIRGDVFFNMLNQDDSKVNYHIEFQTKNDNTMVIRMFEYGFNKGKEDLNTNNQNKNTQDHIKTIYFPRQRVIFFEENREIEDILKLRIIFSDNQKNNIYSASNKILGVH
ncbi:Rpn family recombination-promoting nuclease/putative transposase [Clostridium senegalense]|uniref:Rpn family recombination-promoting nuclease/putative transposase n=1 Tax=Clostridium senegalense TaxID=1465809 RepID=UPI001F158C02|nr:Rpn family recombination-promoting nuclease/putative transposase [Clostridium senegalense]